MYVVLYCFTLYRQTRTRLDAGRGYGPVYSTTVICVRSTANGIPYCDVRAIGQPGGWWLQKFLEKEQNIRLWKFVMGRRSTNCQEQCVCSKILNSDIIYIICFCMTSQEFSQYLYFHEKKGNFNECCSIFSKTARKKHDQPVAHLHWSAFQKI